MHWRTKAAIQNAVARLPSGLSYAVYYWIQRRFGGLKGGDPVDRLAAGVETWRRLREQGFDGTGKSFFEVGTGLVPLAPLAYWLMGAGRTITIDLNPYLKDELVRESVGHIATYETEIARGFGEFLQRSRLDALLELYRSGRFMLSRFLDLCCIEYLAPADAAKTGLPSSSVDVHTSYTVLEHIPPDVLTAIMTEGTRIVRSDGLFVHLVDYTDHFAHTDKSISPINFLQFSESEWDKLAGNRYMYMNRLRHDDVLNLFDAAGHQVIATVPVVDRRLGELVALGEIRLDERFSGKPPDVLSTLTCWIVSQQKSGRDARE